jgi:hypothetical protein
MEEQPFIETAFDVNEREFFRECGSRVYENQHELDHDARID